MTAEPIHRDSFHETHLDKNVPLYAQYLQKTRGGQRPVYPLYYWLNYNMYSEENPPGATTTADFRNGMVIRYSEHQYEQKHRKHRDNTISTAKNSVKPLETLAQLQAY